MGTLANKTIHGIKWSTTATIINLILQVGYTAVMARLLDPVEFGLMAMANVFMRFGGYFANMGMSQAIIQKANLTEQDKRASFTTSVALGVLFFGIVYLVAPLASRLFNSAEVVPIVRVLSINFLFSSLSTTSSSLIRRDLKFQQYSIILIIAFAFQSGIGIILAYMGFGVWSLVYTGILNSIIFAILTYSVARHSLLLIFDWKVYKPLFSFGSKITVINFLEFLSSNIDTMLIGRYLGAVLLGIYNRATLLIHLPLQQLNTSVSRVLFPAFSSIQNDIKKLSKIYLSSSTVIAFLALSVCAGAAVAAENIVLVVLGNEWRDAIPILQILAMVMPFKLLSHYGGIVCDSLAKLTLKIIVEVVYLSTLIFVLYLIRNTNLINYAFVILIWELFKLIAYTILMKNFLKFNFLSIFNIYYPAVLSSIFVSGAIFLTNKMIEPIGFNNIIELIINIIVGGISLLLILFHKINRTILDELNLRLFSQIKFLNKFVNSIISQTHK